MSFARSSSKALKQAAKASMPRATASRAFSLLAREAPKAMVTRLGSTRGVKTLDFAGTKEVVYERADWPLDKLQDYFIWNRIEKQDVVR